MTLQLINDLRVGFRFGKMWFHVFSAFVLLGEQVKEDFVFVLIFEERFQCGLAFINRAAQETVQKHVAFFEIEQVAYAVEVKAAHLTKSQTIGGR